MADQATWSESTMKTTTGALALILATLGTGPARAQDDPGQHAQQPPTSGQLLRDIQQQELARTLSDRVARMQPEPDQPYEVIDGGMPLPPELCQQSPQDCQPTAEEHRQ